MWGWVGWDGHFPIWCVSKDGECLDWLGRLCMEGLLNLVIQQHSMDKITIPGGKMNVKAHQVNNEGTNLDTRRDGIMEGQVWSGIRVKTMYKSKKNIFSLYNKKHLKKTRNMYRQRGEARIPGSQIEGLTFRETNNK